TIEGRMERGLSRQPHLVKINSPDSPVPAEQQVRLSGLHELRGLAIGWWCCRMSHRSSEKAGRPPLASGSICSSNGRSGIRQSVFPSIKPVDMRQCDGGR
ncbi:hypothetical protein ACWGTI_29270, partial [Mesorhizobium sp. ArgA1]